MNSDSASPRRLMQRSNSESACGNSAGVQIGATEIEVADPGVQQAVRLGQDLDRLAGSPLFSAMSPSMIFAWA